MLKYSTYQSIYDKAPLAEANEHNNVTRVSNQLKEYAVSFFEGSSKLFQKDLLIKLSLIIVLIISGLTVVGNAFADTTTLIKEEKSVVVEPGDTLWSIALKNKPSDMKTTVYIKGIQRSSGLAGSQIKAGDILTLPNY